jgi:hypothetical protein
MIKSKLRPIFSIILAVMLIAGFFSMDAFAQGFEDVPEEALFEEEELPLEDVEDTEDFDAPDAVKSGGGSLSKFKYKSADNIVSTSSTTFETIPNMSKTISNNKKTKMIITFSADAYAANNELMFVVAIVDGNPARPGEVQFTGDTTETWARAHSFTWVSGNLNPGQHTVEIQWRSNSGNQVTVKNRNMVVLYYK